jgi:hypothetical protein
MSCFNKLHKVKFDIHVKKHGSKNQHKILGYTAMQSAERDWRFGVTCRFHLQV